MFEQGVTVQFGWNTANGGQGACGIHRSMDQWWWLGDLKLVFYCRARDNLRIGSQGTERVEKVQAVYLV